MSPRCRCWCRGAAAGRRCSRRSAPPSSRPQTVLVPVPTAQARPCVRRPWADPGPTCLLQLSLRLFLGRAERAAPWAGQRSWEALRDGAADSQAAHYPPVAGWPPGEPSRAGRRLPSFGPSGHVGAGRALNPRGRPHEQRAATSALARELHELPSLRRPDPEALPDRGQERSLRSRRCAIPAGHWTTSPGKESWAPIGGMARCERWQ